MDSPAVPKPLGTDEEDVAWALATAEAMWARGDRADAVKWIRKAAEAASEADDILRAADLASAAADLANALDPSFMTPPPRPAAALHLNKTMQSHKSQVPQGPAAPKAQQPAPVRVAEIRRNSPPTGIVSLAHLGQKPSAAVAPKPAVSPRPGVTAPRAPVTQGIPQQAQRVPPRTGATTGNRPREPHDPVPMDATAELAALPPNPIEKRQSAPPPRPSTAPAAIAPTAPPRASMESAATAQNESDVDNWELPHTIAIPVTRPVVDTPPEFVDPAKLGASAQPSGTTPSGSRVAEARKKVNTMTEVDREVPAEVGRRTARLQASQAFHVVLWKDARGVHVAPSGTVVSAITVDAILIALDPSADLSAWLQPSATTPSTTGGNGTGTGQ